MCIVNAYEITEITSEISEISAVIVSYGHMYASSCQCLCYGKKGEVDRRRGGKTIVKGRQGCTLPADLEQLKQDRLIKMVVAKSFVVPQGIARL